NAEHFSQALLIHRVAGGKSAMDDPLPELLIDELRLSPESQRRFLIEVVYAAAALQLGLGQTVSSRPYDSQVPGRRRTSGRQWSAHGCLTSRRLQRIGSPNVGGGWQSPAARLI